MSEQYDIQGRMMKTTFFAALFMSILCNIALEAKTYNFEADAVGSSPKGWHCSKKNKQHWVITQKGNTHVLTLLQTDAYGSHFNTCYTKEINFQNGTLSLDLQADSGEEDQGGGLIWRVKDNKNYYVVRYNPLEDNFTFYYVKNGYRRVIQNRSVYAEKKAWHTIKVLHKREHYRIFFDGTLLLEGNDTTLSEAGGVGVWSKADALSSFDNLKVIP